MSLVEAPARQAPAADQQPVGRRRDHGQIRLPSAHRAGAPGSSRRDRRRAMIASAARVRIGRIAWSSTVSSPSTSGGSVAPAEPVPSYQARTTWGSRSAIAGDHVDLSKIGAVQRLVGPHRGADRAHQKAEIAPVDFQVLELQDGPGREQPRQIARIEPDRRQQAPATGPGAAAEAARSADRPRSPGRVVLA